MKGAKLRNMSFEELVRASGYNSYTLAKKINKSQATIHRWFKGVNQPNYNTTIILALLLGTDITTLVEIFAEQERKKNND